MPPAKRDRRTANDYSTPSQSRKSSISVSEHTTSSSAVGRRRSSIPHITTITSPASSISSKRLPLAPLDPQYQVDLLVEDYADMPDDDKDRKFSCVADSTELSPLIKLNYSTASHSLTQRGQHHIHIQSLPAVRSSRLVVRHCQRLPGL